MLLFKILFSAIGVALTAVLLLMLFSSVSENKRKTALKALYILPFTSFLIIVPHIISTKYEWLIVLSDFIFTALSIYIFMPGYFFRKQDEAIARERIDERTVMFSRNELKPGTDRYEKYYKRYPEHKGNDDNFRKMSGLLSKESAFYNPLAYRAAESTFSIVDSLHQFVEGSSVETDIKLRPEQYDSFILNWAKKMGAVSVGFTKMKDYHWYSTGGRGDRYDKPINGKHQTGIVFTVEMDKEMVDSSPKSSIIMESANKYLQAGIIATQIAQLIRECGFEARAHIDGNYQIVAPLVARDANLGEIGRMGLLMTPDLGPRVRLGVVTTNMPLTVSKRKYDDSYEDFCSKCLKCAVNCPASAIPTDGKSTIKNIKRWQINSEKCYNYWCNSGTDCGRCMSVCPYSHPKSMMHNMVRWSIRQFPNFRFWAVKLDDYFYGRKPSPARLPYWIENN